MFPKRIIVTIHFFEYLAEPFTIEGKNSGDKILII